MEINVLVYLSNESFILYKRINKLNNLFLKDVRNSVRENRFLKG